MKMTDQVRIQITSDDWVALDVRVGEGIVEDWCLNVGCDGLTTVSSWSTDKGNREVRNHHVCISPDMALAMAEALRAGAIYKLFKKENASTP